ncbi:MAG: hypothetical protein H7A21_14285 [Spirochaetales bacterium]|nr:hypothetical protein [Leptospiraceae bacterium]MCP5482600.1 hypothetical protein [Spirochaetales bacterium]MCP5485189.1 hypothetical protein [Spirochaetales bacterium]
MARKQIIVLLSILGAVALIAVLIIVIGGEGDGQRDGGGDVPWEQLGGDDAYPDAPNPADDLEQLDQIRNLWPDVFEPRPDREEVAQQWREFAARYPSNIYIPPQFQPELSEAERAERLRVLDTVTDVQGRIASVRARSRADVTGDPPAAGPNAPGQPTVTPAEQRTFFQYRIQELESRIQLIEYALEQGEVDSDQVARGRAQLEELKAEKAELEEVLARVPA